MDRMGNCTVRVPARKTLTELVFSEEALRLMHKVGKEEDFRLGRLEVIPVEVSVGERDQVS